MDDSYISLYIIQIKIQTNHVMGIEITLIPIFERLDYIIEIFSNDNYLYWLSYNKSGFYKGQMYYDTNII